MCLLFTISLKLLQQNILESNCFHFLFHKKKYIVFLKNIYVINHNYYVRRHSRMRQIAPFKKQLSREHAT